MNNQDVLAVLEGCRQTLEAGPVEPTEEAKEDFQRCTAALSTELSMLLQEAVAMKWPFVPEKWQYKRSVTSEDKTNLKELISQHLPQLLMFVRASLLAGEPLWAISAVFLMDRFLYWADASASLLRIAKSLHKRYPATPVAPQLVIRQARVSLNSGKLQKAEYILSSLINNSGATGCWVYRVDSDQTLVQAVSLQVRGQVLQKLGLWIEAAELIWVSLIGFHSLPEPDKKGIGTSLGLLANILMSMDDVDFQAFTTSPHIDLRFLKERGHRLLSAAEAAKLAVVYSQYASLYVLTNVVTQGTCLLSYSFSAACPSTEKETFLTRAKEAFQIGLLTKREGEVVTSLQELHTFVKAAYSLTVTHRCLGSVPWLVSEADRVCQEALEKLYAYSTADGRERDSLGREIVHLVGQVKTLLRVEPFPTSDEGSFIPDGYGVAEESPVRFPLDCFSAAMARFQQYHASVCEASDSTCDRTPHGSKGQASSVACITAMRTAAETMETACATENHQPQSTLGREQGKHTDGRFKRLSASSGSLSNSLGPQPPSRLPGSSSSVGLMENSYSSVTGGTTGRGHPLEAMEERTQNLSSTHVASGSLELNEVKIRDRGRGTNRNSSSSLSDSLGSNSSWQKISHSNVRPQLNSQQDAGRFAKQNLEELVDLQCPTVITDEEDPGRTRGAGCGSERKTSSSSLSSSVGSHSSWQKISLVDTGSPLSSDKDTRDPCGERVEAWVDLQCPTEHSDEQDQDMFCRNASENVASLVMMDRKRAHGSTRGQSASSRDSLDSLFSRNTPSFPEFGGKRGQNNAGISTPTQGRMIEAVDFQCPTELSDKEEWNDGTSSAVAGSEGMGKAKTSSSSLSNSLGSHSSWQKISLCDTGSPLNSDEDTSDLLRQREEVWVDLQCPTEASDEEVHNATSGRESHRSLPVHKPEVPIAKLQPQPSGLTKPSTNVGAPLSNPSSGSRQSGVWCRSRDDRSCRYGHADTETAAPGANEIATPADWMLGHCPHLLGQQEVDPLEETEEDPFEDLGVPTPALFERALESSGAGLAVTCSEYEKYDVPAEKNAYEALDSQGPMGTDSLGHLGHEERNFVKLSLEENQRFAGSNQSHDQCPGHCMRDSEVPQGSLTLTEQDYKALLSGVCHKCLLKRLKNTGTFQLKKHNSTYSSLLLKYSKVTGRWTSRETKVYIGAPMGEGKQRTAFWVKFLHQEETLGSYVGKTYQYAKEVHYHLNDVERQMTAQYYVTEFNKRLYKKKIPAQIFFIPSEVLLLKRIHSANVVMVGPPHSMAKKLLGSLLDYSYSIMMSLDIPEVFVYLDQMGNPILEGDVIEDCVTIEPYMLGDFVKLTNNTTETNRKYKATEYGIAFGHFTYQLSRGTEVVVDLQGWVTANGKGLTYLTDPQLHTLRKPKSPNNFGERGIRQFLEVQHGPRCNDICNRLSLGNLPQPRVPDQ